MEKGQGELNANLRYRDYRDRRDCMGVCGLAVVANEKDDRQMSTAKWEIEFSCGRKVKVSTRLGMFLQNVFGEHPSIAELSSLTDKQIIQRYRDVHGDSMYSHPNVGRKCFAELRKIAPEPPVKAGLFPQSRGPFRVLRTGAIVSDFDGKKIGQFYGLGDAARFVEIVNKYDRDNESRQFTVKCSGCGKDFWTSNRKRRICSPECRPAAHRNAMTRYLQNTGDDLIRLIPKKDR